MGFVPPVEEQRKWPLIAKDRVSNVPHFAWCRYSAVDVREDVFQSAADRFRNFEPYSLKENLRGQRQS